MNTRSRLCLAILAAAAGCTFDPSELSTPGVKAPDGAIDVSTDHQPGGSDIAASGADYPAIGPEAAPVMADSSVAMDGSGADGKVGTDGSVVEARRDTSDAAADAADAPLDQLSPPLDVPAPRTDAPADTNSQVDAPPAIVCDPPITSTGGLSCPGSVCTVGTFGGPMYTSVDSYGSTICAASNSLCANGNTPSAAAGQMGAVLGFYLDSSATHPTVQLSGAGITFQLTALPPQLMRVWVDHLGTMYCAAISSPSQTIPWTSFRSSCWNTSGSNLTGPPNASYVAFQVAGTATGNFDFCVKSLSLPVQVPDAGSDVVSKLPLGSSCTSGTQCSSGACTTGVCCASSSCTGCYSGCGSNGQCQPCAICDCTAGVCHC